MRYMLLIYDNERALASKSEAELGALMQSWGAYMDKGQKSGKMLGGDALQPTMTATTVRATSGRTITSDGPFAETKEQLGGFVIVNARDLDEAIEWASTMPHLAEGGSVEVRPIQEFEPR